MKTQVAIIGGGPGGATAAMYMLREGLDTLIIEMDEFPRYHIGESMTGECGALMRDLGLEDRMRVDGHPVKQGVKVYGKSARGSWFIPVMQRLENGELQEQFTWQVRRDGFDKMMLDEALSRGATLLRGKATGVLRADDGTVTGVKVRMPDGTLIEVQSDVVLDVSGQKNFLAHQGVTARKEPGRYDKQIAIFSQVEFAVRDNGEDRENHKDNTLIFYAERYRWAWFIPLNERHVSVGVVIPSAYFQGRGESRHDFLVRELRELHPELSRRLPEIRLIEEARAIPNYSFFVENWTGKGFACVGDAHRFIDPIFSFGLYLSMKESQLIAPHVRRYVNGETRHLANPFAEHQTYCDAALESVQDLIDGFWGEPISFSFLVHGKRTRADIIDLFAGRVYSSTVSQGSKELKVIAEKARAEGVLWGEPHAA